MAAGELRSLRLKSQSGRKFGDSVKPGGIGRLESLQTDFWRLNPQNSAGETTPILALIRETGVYLRQMLRV